jgi:LPXTG-motif cell wall-anchored protein
MTGRRRASDEHRFTGARATARKYLAMLGIATMLSAGAVVAGATPSLADAAGVVGVSGDTQPWTENTNHAWYWEGVYSAQQAVCFKIESAESSSYGAITSGGKTVTLNAFDPSWPGDHWEALIIKGGSNWNNVIDHPEAGVAYASPLNAGGQQTNVSHWIVCSGTTPTPPPTQHDPEVTRTDWVDEAWVCGDTTTEQTRTVTTTPYKLDGQTWVLDTTKADTVTERRTRNLTQDEITECPVDCTTRYDFDAQKMWEVTWGYGFSDRNGGAPTFTMQSNGGLVGLDGGPVPSYMANNPDWHWLYVTDGKDNNHTYQFADGTTRTVTVTFADGEDGCSYPTIVWGETPPPPPVTEIPVPAQPTASDPCGLNNATWVKPENTDQVTWVLGEDGVLTASAAEGFTFPDGETSHSYGTAPDSGQACSTPSTPQDAVASATALDDETCDRVGTVSFAITNATWKDASDTTDGSRVAVADAGHLFAGGVQEQTVTYTVNPKKSGADCVILPQVGGVKVTPPPTKVEGVKHTAPPVVTPTVEGVKHEAAAALPRTGTEAGWYGAAGILLLMMGSGLVLVTRRGTAKH